MKVIYAKTILEKIKDEVAKAEREGKFIDYLILDDQEYAELTNIFRSSLDFAYDLKFLVEGKFINVKINNGIQVKVKIKVEA